MNARKGMSSDSRGTKTTAYFDKLDESSAASVSLVEWLMLHVGRRTKSIYMEEKMKFPFASNRTISQDIRDACVFSLSIVSLKSAKSF